MSETLRDSVVSLSLDSDYFSQNLTAINKQIKDADSDFFRCCCRSTESGCSQTNVVAQRGYVRIEDPEELEKQRKCIAEQVNVDTDVLQESISEKCTGSAESGCEQCQRSPLCANQTM